MWFRKFIITIAIIIVLIFIAIVYPFFYGIPHGVTSEIKKIGCSGIIVSVDTTSPCFVDISVKQKNDTVKLTVCYCASTNSFEFAAVGDSIEKRSGELFLFVTKINTGVTKKFDYPICIE